MTRNFCKSNLMRILEELKELFTDFTWGFTTTTTFLWLPLDIQFTLNVYVLIPLAVVVDYRVKLIGPIITVIVGPF